MKKYMSVVNFFSVNGTRCCNETVSYSNLRINSINKKRNYHPGKELTFRLQERGMQRRERGIISGGKIAPTFFCCLSCELQQQSVLRVGGLMGWKCFYCLPGLVYRNLFYRRDELSCKAV